LPNVPIKDGGLHALRQVKHRASVFVKHASWGFPQVRGPLGEPAHRLRQSLFPVEFPAEKYADTWLGASTTPRPIAPGEAVPRRIFAIWAGTNPMSSRREAGLTSLRQMNPHAEVVLVTPDNLPRWLVPGHPLPRAYGDLSLVHKSDYLRCYLLHHHGGGYADIKRFRHAWDEPFRELENSGQWLAGYTEVHRINAPLVGGPLQGDLRRASRQLLGYGALIARADTPLTAEWYDRVHTVLDEKSDELALHPGNVRGDNPGYPLAWTEVLAHVVAPLTWKHQHHVLHDARLRPLLKRYQ
jgi:hypothetical protein